MMIFFIALLIPVIGGSFVYLRLLKSEMWRLFVLYVSWLLAVVVGGLLAHPGEGAMGIVAGMLNRCYFPMMLVVAMHYTVLENWLSYKAKRAA